ncbi:MAG: anhydro-N-acetylmuramic acid kinase [Xanthomonadaceae bacterium]|nr:anhydro-N-acetylmuramic acid kinase [Xanthomonadaceae bacterium]
MAEPATGRYIGLMSGTSADGIDGVIVEFRHGRLVALVGHLHYKYPDALRRRLIEVSIEQPAITLGEFSSLDARIGDTFADATLALIAAFNVDPATIDAIGSHGQTMFHDGARGLTLQMGDPNRIAAATGIATISDFRRLDLALGGQGAPLVPAFHQALFSDAEEDRCALNLGGIANITALPADGQRQVIGFDTGPANALMDEWALRCTGQPFDDNGAFAAGGSPDEQLVTALLSDPYFSRPAPKSTGRDYFRLEWAVRRYPAMLTLRPQDVQASLAQLTVCSIAESIRSALPGTARLIVCGGGARNQELLRLLAAALPGVVVETSARHGLAPEFIEATAFAWLAMRRMTGQTGNLPSVTGARRAAVLGSVLVPPAPA